MKHWHAPTYQNQYSIWEFSPNGLSILKSKAWNAKHQGGEGYAKSRQVAVVSCLSTLAWSKCIKVPGKDSWTSSYDYGVLQKHDLEALTMACKVPGLMNCVLLSSFVICSLSFLKSLFGISWSFLSVLDHLIFLFYSPCSFSITRSLSLESSIIAHTNGEGTFENKPSRSSRLHTCYCLAQRASSMRVLPRSTAKQST